MRVLGVIAREHAVERKREVRPGRHRHDARAQRLRAVEVGLEGRLRDDDLRRARRRRQRRAQLDQRVRRPRRRDRRSSEQDAFVEAVGQHDAIRDRRRETPPFR